MLAPADNGTSVERQLFNEEEQEELLSRIGHLFFLHLVTVPHRVGAHSLGSLTMPTRTPIL